MSMLKEDRLILLSVRQATLGVILGENDNSKMKSPGAGLLRDHIYLFILIFLYFKAD